YTPSSTNATLNLTLMHQLAQITTSVTTNIGALNSIQNATLTPHFSNGSFPLNTGVMAGRTTSAPQTIDFTGNNFPIAVNTTASATPVLINASTTGNQASFSANLNIGGTAKTVNFANAFNITPGTRNTLSLQISKCGAWMNAAHTQWKEFMCQNLGATAGINPFSPIAGNHGGKFLWGVNDIYISQSTDQANAGPLLPWVTGSPSDGLWTGTGTGGTGNVCPAGYRVPSQTEWSNAVKYNTIEQTGTWTDSSNNYSTAFYLVDPISKNRTLMLPAAGLRDGSDGHLLYRGIAYYWSGTGINGSGNSYYLYFDKGGPDTTQAGGRLYALSVRCIAQ
ncbi:TPA: hypothetical protein NEG48_003792, partial [Elizabethkingia anophelis]|nr:hypothetical protein [Elizabethkingia anophelis]